MAQRANQWFPLISDFINLLNNTQCHVWCFQVVLKSSFPSDLWPAWFTFVMFLVSINRQLLVLALQEVLGCLSVTISAIFFEFCIAALGKSVLTCFRNPCWSDTILQYGWQVVEGWLVRTLLKKQVTDIGW